MSNNNGNNFRREWDKEAFEKRAKERLEAEMEAEREEEREHKKTAPAPIVQRAPLMRRTEDLQLAKHVNLRQVVTGLDQGAYFCKVCDCHLRDSANYLAHINGRKHNRMLGMSMRAERSSACYAPPAAAAATHTLHSLLRCHTDMHKRVCLCCAASNGL